MSQPTTEQRQKQKEDFRKMVTDEITTRMDGEYTAEALQVMINALVEFEFVGLRAQYISQTYQTEQEGRQKILQLRELVWGEDIASSTCPEYKEHHESIQKILRYIDTDLLGRK